MKKLFLLLLLTSYAFAASPKPQWAKSCMVTSCEPMATEVGLDILEKGGNAVDAAAAVALALGVTESYSSGIGGGCFIVIRMADGTAAAIDGRETAPAKSTRLMYVPKDTTQDLKLSEEGALACGTPGEVAALELAVKKYGKLPFSEAVSGAIALADSGFAVSMRTARALDGEKEKLKRFEGTRKIFFKNDSTPLQFGDRLTQKDLAATLKLIQQKGAAGFYQGKTPQTVEKYLKTNGGILSEKDFAGYEPHEYPPVKGTYKGYEILSMPPPSSGGIHVLQVLNLLEPYDLNYLGAGSSESYHLIGEAMKIAFADRAEFLGDPAFTKVPSFGLISKDYAKERRGLINRLSHEKQDGAGNPFAFDKNADANPDHKHTTHLCVWDQWGNCVSLTATINTPFGSGLIVPGTGFFLNNEMDDFVTWPGKPNYFGLVGKAANEVAPGKRPLSSMSPTIVLKDNKPYMVVGAMGGPRIITATLLTILNSVDFGMTLQEAMDFPRVHQQWMPDLLYMEQQIPADVGENLKVKGHNIKIQKPWAAVTAISADPQYGGLWGAADSRTGGLAKGF